MNEIQIPSLPQTLPPSANPITWIREQLGFTREAFANLLDVSDQLVKKVEQGAVVRPHKILGALKNLGFDPETILEGYTAFRISLRQCAQQQVERSMRAMKTEEICTLAELTHAGYAHYTFADGSVKTLHFPHLVCPRMPVPTPPPSEN